MAATGNALVLTFESGSSGMSLPFDAEMHINVEEPTIYEDFGVMSNAVEVDRTTDPYTGEYEAVPVFEEQTLRTNGKYMRQNISVKPIPVTMTMNASGGYTCVIGG